MIAERTDRFGRLVRLLKELFQLDKPDLDFGFYRIMHAKEVEVTQFLEDDLLPQVKSAFQQYRSAGRAMLEQQLAEAESDARGLGFDPEVAPKVQELRKAIDVGTDVDALEADVYDRLYRFFRRYYSEGDFISQRVYKDGVYAIPHQGEEVKLHWANADQYYIKSTEYLKDYSFRLRPEAESDPMRVHFRLADAAEGEHGNIKATDEKTRRFVLLAEDFVAEEEGPDGVPELVIRFEYRAAALGDWPKQKRRGKKRPPQQKDLNEAAVTAVLDANDLSLARWMKELDASHVKADGSQADYTRLRSHLDRYTARNTYDYFIHKDLGGFLRRELDFYVKNEVMHLDDIEHENAPRVEEWLSKIKVIRAIAHRIIDFLAQLEGFQKMLWLKKKFVVETSYCVVVGSIPEAFYAEIIANRAQHDEWVDLHGIDELAGDLVRTGYSNPLTTEFLRAHSTLMADTRHFSSDFTERLLEALGTGGSLDEMTDGVLFHSENFQALRLMERRYRGRVDCVYIDPPFNAPNSEIAYKNNYKHSSFLSLIESRLELSRGLAAAAGSHVVAIDKHEANGVERLIDSVFPAHDNVAVTVEHNRRGVQGDHFSYSHEHALFSVPRSRKALNRNERQEDEWEWSRFRNWGGESLRTDGANCFYAVLVRGNRILGFGDVWTDEDAHPSGANVARTDGVIEVFPIDGKGIERKWRWERGTVETLGRRLRVKSAKNGTLDIEIAKTTDQFKTVWRGPRYNAGDNGTKVCRSMGLPMGAFDYPKSIHTVADCVHAVSDATAFVLDYFAGSGTTSHAIVNLNRTDGGHRRFILVEMAQYFDTVLLPRVKKVTFSPEWENGRPSRLAKPEEAQRGPRIVKVVRLESYEDTLNNLVVRRPEPVEELLDLDGASGPGGPHEDYVVRYMLDVETTDSPSLVNMCGFRNPSVYRLKVKRPASDENREVAVDLVETFNWLLGLRVSSVTATNSCFATFERDREKRLVADISPNGGGRGRLVVPRR